MECIKLLKDVHGDNLMSRSRVFEWHKRFTSISSMGSMEASAIQSRSCIMRLPSFQQAERSYGGKRFSNDEEVQTAVLEWLHDQQADLCRQGIERLVKRSDLCLQRQGDYVKK